MVIFVTAQRAVGQDKIPSTQRKHPDLGMGDRPSKSRASPVPCAAPRIPPPRGGSKPGSPRSPGEPSVSPTLRPRGTRPSSASRPEIGPRSCAPRAPARFRSRKAPRPWSFHARRTARAAASSRPGRPAGSERGGRFTPLEWSARSGRCPARPGWRCPSTGA